MLVGLLTMADSLMSARLAGVSVIPDSVHQLEYQLCKLSLSHMWTTYMLYEQFPSPIPIVVFAVFQTLACILQPPICETNYIMLMNSPACSLFLKWVLILKDPALHLRVICLSCHLVMSTEHCIVPQSLMGAFQPLTQPHIVSSIRQHRAVAVASCYSWKWN